jgi:hypothetical protein
LFQYTLKNERAVRAAFSCAGGKMMGVLRRLFPLMTGLSLVLCITMAISLWGGSFAFKSFVVKSYKIDIDQPPPGFSIQTDSLRFCRQSAWPFPEKPRSQAAVAHADIMQTADWGLFRTFVSDELVSSPLGAAGFSPQRKLHTDIVELPFSSWMKLFAILPLVWCILRLFRWKRSGLIIAVGPRCPHCGYDLRATPFRCPECGAMIPVKQESVSVSN